MKKIILLTILLSVILAACQHSDKKANNLLSKEKLLSQLFTININKDTTLTTAYGAFIHIPEGALSGSGNSTVQLEIKEAYSIEQIVMAGLTTQSNGQPLSSGGMIYINATAGQSIKITKAISIKIPTPSINKNMKLFTGDTDETGKINWVKPASLPENPQTFAFNNGKILFNNSCASCHAIGSDGTGPDLAHILVRTPDKKLLYAYTRNSQKVIQEGNGYYRCLHERRNNTFMNLFPALTDQNLDDLYGYIENESNVRNLPIIKDNIRPCIDSCRTYREIKSRLENQKETLSQEKVKMVIEKVINSVAARPGNSSITSIEQSNTSVSVNTVSPVSNQTLFYQFTIETFGWCNIDILMKDASSAESRLVARIVGQYKENISLYLVIPSAKFFKEGGLLEGKKDEYGFYLTDGKIPLPQNVKAYVIAMGESEDKIIFAKKDFFTTTSLDFDMSLSTVTAAFFNAAIKDIGAADIRFSVKDTQNADTLRKIIKDLKDTEKIKPKNCDCNCGVQSSPALDEGNALKKDTTKK